MAVALTASAASGFVSPASAGPHDALIAKHAAANGVPEDLIHRVVGIESRGNASAVHAGNYGLMQIRLGTARGVGYSGEANGLLDADTNLTYAVRYLAGAYRAAGCDADLAVKYYQRGYYGTARRECGESPAAKVQLAQADAKAKREAAGKPEAAAAKPDVIRPKLVRTESIGASKSGSMHPVGNFEPARVAPPVAAAFATAKPASVAATPKFTPDSQLPAAKYELASVPMPPVRSELEATPKVDAKLEPAPIPLPPVRPAFDESQKLQAHPAHRTERVRKKTKAQAKVGGKSAPDSTSFKIDDPAGVVTFLKKLVTPDKKPRKAQEADAEAPR